MGYEKKQVMYKEVLRELDMLNLEKRKMCVREDLAAVRPC